MFSLIKNVLFVKINPLLSTKVNTNPGKSENMTCVRSCFFPTAPIQRMDKMVFSLVFVCLLSFGFGGYCTRSNSTCWPTKQNLSELYSQLNPSQQRRLVWQGEGYPRVCAVPLGSAMEQPLYGVGEEIAPLALSEEEGVTCFEGGVKSLFCALTVRNQPLYESPAIVVWPLTAEQVQLSVQFARKHNLCIAVAGTGHDFQNRHSCKNDGFFIRTTLMKDMAYNEDGTLTLGPGLTFSEIHKFVASKGRIVSSGWATTVGIIGWSIGGGHGPFAPSLGKGVDNVVAATLVTADGELVEVNR